MVSSPPYTIGSLFSGIGGLELGLERAGVGRTIWQVEREPFCQAVLQKHWPDAERFDDVKTVGRHNLKPVDVICGGFPCQDISYAGKGAGLAGARSGLWFEYTRIIGELRPSYVVVENVAALRRRGLDTVLGDLAALGYDAIWLPIRASDVGAPHRRERLFVLAHATEFRRDRHSAQLGSLSESETEGGLSELKGGSLVGHTQGRNGQGFSDQTAPNVGSSSGDARRIDQLENTKPGMGRTVDGLSQWLDRWPSRPGEAQKDWEAPRITGGHVSNKTARLKALGNAVVPQVGYVVGKILLTL
jgi:DNA (cytosine-5)-methyltransferase 1